MSDPVTSVFNTLVEGLPASRRWLAFAGILFFAIASIMMLEHQTGLGYYYSLGRRVELLGRLNQLSKDGIAANPQLAHSYARSIEDLERRNVTPFDLRTFGVVSSPTSWKFLSGAALGILLSLSGLFQKSQGAVLFLAGLAFALLFGFVAVAIPTLGSPWVNYLGFPVVQALTLYLLGRRKAAV